LTNTWKYCLTGIRLFMFQVFFLIDPGVSNIGNQTPTHRSTPPLAATVNVARSLGTGSEHSAVKNEQQQRPHNRSLQRPDRSKIQLLQEACDRILKINEWVDWFDFLQVPRLTAVQLEMRLKQAIVNSAAVGYHNADNIQPGHARRNSQRGASHPSPSSNGHAKTTAARPPRAYGCICPSGVCRYAPNVVPARALSVVASGSNMPWSKLVGARPQLQPTAAVVNLSAKRHSGF